MTASRALGPLAAASLLWMAGPAAAQTDAQVWLEGGVDYQLSDSVELGFEQHLRFDEDVSRVAAVMPEIGVGIDLSDWLEVGAAYRFEYERDGSGDLEARHRFHVEGDAGIDVGPLELGYRLRFQEQLRPDGELRHTLRNRAGIEHERLDPWKPGVSLELFHRLGGGDGASLRKLRITAGIGYELGGAHELEVFYRLELPQDDATDPTVHIVGLGYDVSI